MVLGGSFVATKPIVLRANYRIACAISTGTAVITHRRSHTGIAACQPAVARTKVALPDKEADKGQRPPKSGYFCVEPISYRLKTGKIECMVIGGFVQIRSL